MTLESWRKTGQKRDNTIGDVHVENGCGTQYWVYGQNCYWWAYTTALRNVGPGGNMNDVDAGIAGFNFGFGPNKRLGHNAAIAARLESEANGVWRWLFKKNGQPELRQSNIVQDIWIRGNQAYDRDPRAERFGVWQQEAAERLKKELAAKGYMNSYYEELLRW